MPRNILHWIMVNTIRIADDKNPLGTLSFDFVGNFFQKQNSAFGSQSFSFPFKIFAISSKIEDEFPIDCYVILLSANSGRIHFLLSPKDKHSTFFTNIDRFRNRLKAIGTR